MFQLVVFIPEGEEKRFHAYYSRANGNPFYDPETPFVSGSTMRETLKKARKIAPGPVAYTRLRFE